MNTVAGKFEEMGARVRLSEIAWSPDLRIDVRSDRRGEFFDLRVPSDLTLQVLDVRPDDRHLVLLVRGEDKQRFLCGHDERHWFVAAIPESIPVTTVDQAKNALKPVGVRRAERPLPRKHRTRRRAAAYIRQGEWFFLPAPDLQVEEWHILRDEPLIRGRGTPHIAEQVVRSGGETVYVCGLHPNGLGARQYHKLLRRHPPARTWSWTVMTRDPEVYARGRVSHPDHKTVMLRGWHRVLPNTEAESRAARSLAFLD